jgi:pimeloyl-ACP methyl ester carboxylesterase
LLFCGILASLLYVAMNVFVAMQWKDYSSAAQTVSELSAIGAPTRPLWLALAFPYTLLMAAFGWGVWASADGSRTLRVVGGSMIAYGIIGLGWPFAPMHLREVLAAGGGTLTDTLHIAFAMVTVGLMLVAMSFAAAALGRGFRLYSIASMVVLFVGGVMTSLDAPRVQANLPTPWTGVWERINIGMFLLWVIVLTIALLRGRETSATRRGTAAYLAAYDAAMASWPVPYEDMEIASRFGTTHVVASGPKDAPPLVLLHGYWATLTMWAPNVEDLSKDHRVYAIDVMGQPGKSIPGEPVRNASEYVAWLTATLDALHLGRVSLVGMSYGGWLALTYAITAPARVQALVLLSPAASFLPLVRPFSLRGMLMVFWPTRLTVRSFMRWLGFIDRAGDAARRRAGEMVVDLMYLGMKHIRIPRETMRIAPTVFADEELRAVRVPTLVLIGEHEVIYDPAAALARARRLIPVVDGDLVPRSSHDMCVSQHQLVDRRILDFLERTEDAHDSRTPDRAHGRHPVLVSDSTLDEPLGRHAG